MASRFTRITAIFGSDVDNMALFTQRDFDGSTVGFAWIGTFCSTTRYGGSINQATTTVTGWIAQIFAHETGHNWGMQHDSASGFIMNPSSDSSDVPTMFSSTSIGYLNTFYSSTYLPLTNSYRHCLENVGGAGNSGAAYNNPGQYCGNGILEGTEQCDAGSEPDTCCTSTCTLVAGI
jgi:hypothetical protein